MSILRVSKSDFTDSLRNSWIATTPLVVGGATAWGVNKLGCKLLKIDDRKLSSDSILMKAIAIASGIAVSFPVAAYMPLLTHFPRQKILHLVGLTLFDLYGVIPGYFGQRSLYVMGFIGSCLGPFLDPFTD